jgi:Arc-like DNA binding domain
MVHRKSLIQVKFRIRQDVLRKLEREAKRHDRSTNDEIGRRLEESLSYGDWQEQRERLFLAMMKDLETHDNPAATKAAVAKMTGSAERYIQDQTQDIFPAEEMSRQHRKKRQ